RGRAGSPTPGKGPVRTGKSDVPSYEVVIRNTAIIRVDFVLCDSGQNCNQLYLEGETNDAFSDCSGYCRIRITTEGRPAAEYDLKAGGRYEIGWNHDRQRY